LRELVTHMAISRKLAADLTAMDTQSLTKSTKYGREMRDVYLQLATASVAEAKLIASLAVKLRLARTTAMRKIAAERERARSPSGPRPWDATERH
jgi:hypothetical protein